MLTQYEKWLKGAGKSNAKRYQQRLNNYNNNPKLCAYCKHPLSYELRNNKYCDHTCSASFTNKSRSESGYSLKGKTKASICTKCNSTVEIGCNASALRALCTKCKLQYVRKHCKQCKNIFYGRPNRKTCSNECASLAKRIGAINGGKKSAAIQSQIRRSKNEIYFAELCKLHFTNVLTNEPLFNGWDADIILPDFKIAIMWNGAWHYKQITKKHSVEQVQNRDKIKIKEIEQAGYASYVIKDLGIENKEFVINQFNKFLKNMAGVGIEPNALFRADAYETSDFVL